MSDQIRICNNHRQRIPLLWTFRFPGAEYWCPYCGFTGDMLGSGIMVKATPKLCRDFTKWKLKAERFLAEETNEWIYKVKSTDKI